MEGYEGIFKMLKYLASDMVELDVVEDAVTHYIPMFFSFIDCVV